MTRFLKASMLALGVIVAFPVQAFASCASDESLYNTYKQMAWDAGTSNEDGDWMTSFIALYMMHEMELAIDRDCYQSPS